MRRLLILGAVAALGLAGGAARAQDAGPAVAPEVNGRCAGAEVESPTGLCLEIPDGAPLAACVFGAAEGIDGREAVDVLLAIRRIGGFDWLTVAGAPATGVYAGAPVGSCLVLEAAG